MDAFYSDVEVVHVYVLSTIVLSDHFPRLSNDNAFFPSTEDSDEDEPAPAEPT